MDLDYSAARAEVRQDLRDSHGEMLEHLRRPGSWFTGEQRLAIATEARLAKGSTAQIPVRPDVAVPEHVRRPDQVGKTMRVNWDRVGSEYDKWVGHVRAKLAGAEESSPLLLWIVAVVVVVAAAVVILLKKATGETS